MSAIEARMGRARGQGLSAHCRCWLVVLHAALPWAASCQSPLGQDGPAPACPSADCSTCPESDTSGPFVALAAAQTPVDVGAAQGLDVRDGMTYLYGDAKVGIIAELRIDASGLAIDTGRRARLTVSDTDIIGHPTGLTSEGQLGTFIGKSADEGWIYEVDWQELLATGSLDTALLHEMRDDLSPAGSRPEWVRSGATWFLATADYSAGHSHVRLYDPQAVRLSTRSSDPGVLVASFEAGPFVQSLYFDPLEGTLMLIRNPERGHGWIVELVDLEASIAAGASQLLWSYNPDEPGELEGFHSLGDGRGVFVTSSATKNLRLGRLCPGPTSP